MKSSKSSAEEALRTIRLFVSEPYIPSDLDAATDLVRPLCSNLEGIK
jgi:hypothetical protein